MEMSGSYTNCSLVLQTQLKYILLPEPDDILQDIYPSNGSLNADIADVFKQFVAYVLLSRCRLGPKPFSI